MHHGVLLLFTNRWIVIHLQKPFPESAAPAGTIGYTFASFGHSNTSTPAPAIAGTEPVTVRSKAGTSNPATASTPISSA